VVCPRIRKPRRIARDRRWRWQRRVLLLCLIGGAVWVLALVYNLFTRSRAPASNPVEVAQEREFQVRAAIPRRLGRPVYKLSVIPGGAYSVEELRQALDSDEVAARHYAVFRRASLRMEQSRFVQPVYVSYRVGDAVFWTRHPVALVPDETLLTDGANFARARCGNRVAVEPQSPVQAANPPAAVFDHVDAPAPNPAADKRDEPLLAAEVFPAYSPAMTEEIQPADPGGALAVQVAARDVPIDESPVLELRHIALAWPLECWSTVSPQSELPGAQPVLRACTELDRLRLGPAGFPLELPPEAPPPTPIPEPGSLVLMLGGLGVAAAVRRLGLP
jgi:hypothetical protein